MDVESFKLSVTDPIQPLLPNLFFSLTLIFQLWESNFPVTQAENSNTNRGSIFNSSLRTPAQPLSRSHWFCVWFLSHSSFPLTPTWFGFSLSLSSHLSSVLFFFFFFWHHCQFCLSVSHCPSKTSRRGTSVCFTFDSSPWAQPGTNHMLSDCCTEPTVCCYYTVIPEIQWTPIAFQIKAG